MRVAYGIAFVVIVAFLLGVAIPADVSWPLRLGLVAACAMLAVMCLWVTVGPSARSPMVLRIVGLAVGGVTFGLTAAGFGVFDPPRPEFEPPSETPSISNTSSVLQSSGYRDVSVTYPKKASGTVLVRYAAAPQLDQPGVASDIAGIVWTHEGVRFQTLTIEAGGTSASFSYEELATQFPPRPSGLDSLTTAHVEALGSVRLTLFEGFDDIGRDATHMAAFFGAGLLALISLVVATWTAFRRPRPWRGVLASA
jgi:hypothetical protein